MNCNNPYHFTAIHSSSTARSFLPLYCCNVRWRIGEQKLNKSLATARKGSAENDFQIESSLLIYYQWHWTDEKFHRKLINQFDYFSLRNKVLKGTNRWKHFLRWKTIFSWCELIQMSCKNNLIHFVVVPRRSEILMTDFHCYDCTRLQANALFVLSSSRITQFGAVVAQV